MSGEDQEDKPHPSLLWQCPPSRQLPRIPEENIRSFCGIQDFLSDPGESIFLRQTRHGFAEFEHQQFTGLVAARDSDIGIGSFARTVDRTAHDRDFPQGDLFARTLDFGNEPFHP